MAPQLNTSVVNRLSGGKNPTAEKLLLAASGLMIERSSIELSLSDIAQKSGVNAALVKYHFGNKDGLLLAAAVYAVVSLSPKLLALVLIKNEYDSNQARLVELEKQVERMGEIANALENDPAFNAAMARADFERERPGEQRIPVDQKSVHAGVDEPFLHLVRDPLGTPS